MFGTSFRYVGWPNLLTISLFPLVFPLFGFAKALALEWEVQTISKYISTIEDVYKFPMLRGWEHIMAEEREEIDFEHKPMTPVRTMLSKMAYRP
jgi:hypothetical protein